MMGIQLTQMGQFMVVRCSPRRKWISATRNLLVLAIARLANSQLEESYLVHPDGSLSENRPMNPWVNLPSGYD